MLVEAQVRQAVEAEAAPLAAAGQARRRLAGILENEHGRRAVRRRAQRVRREMADRAIIEAGQTQLAVDCLDQDLVRVHSMTTASRPTALPCRTPRIAFGASSRR